MGSARTVFGSLATAALLGALLLFAPGRAASQDAAEGPIPMDAAKIEAWVAQWPAWQKERQRLDEDILRLRQRLQTHGEAEANGERPPWWDLPSRRRQAARLRFLQSLRIQLERAEARRFQMQAVESLWKTDLEARQAKGALPDALVGVLKDLQVQAEKDMKNKEESQ